MTTASPSLRPVLAAALVAAVVSAAGTALVLSWRGQDAGEAPGQGLTAGQRAEVEQTVRQYLVDHPEILIEMSALLDQRQNEAQSKAMQTALANNADLLYRSQRDYKVGNPKGDVTVVEFFDYNCGFCRRAMPDLLRLIESDDNVRVVFKELPILRRESEGAARVALAAGMQGKYFEMHRALLEMNGVASAESGLALAAEMGLDVERLKTDMNAPQVDEAIAEARTLAEQIGVQGTPLYLIGDRIIPGAPEDLYDQFVARVEAVRKEGCAEPIAC